MAYTALFIEIVIVGVQTSTWLFLAIVLLKHQSLRTLLTWSNAISASALTLLVPWVYTAGVITDRLADDLFWKVIAPFSLRSKSFGESKFKEMAVAVIESGSAASVEFYRYYLSRVRIMRASALNIPLILLCLGLLRIFPSVPFISFSCVVVLITWWAYITQVERYFSRTSRIYELLQATKQKETTASSLGPSSNPALSIPPKPSSRNKGRRRQHGGTV